MIANFSLPKLLGKTVDPYAAAPTGCWLSCGLLALAAGASLLLSFTCRPWAVWMVAPVAMPTAWGPLTNSKLNLLHSSRDGLR